MPTLQIKIEIYTTDSGDKSTQVQDIKKAKKY